MRYKDTLYVLIPRSEANQIIDCIYKRNGYTWDDRYELLMILGEPSILMAIGDENYAVNPKYPWRIHNQQVLTWWDLPEDVRPPGDDILLLS